MISPSIVKHTEAYIDTLVWAHAHTHTHMPLSLKTYPLAWFWATSHQKRNLKTLSLLPGFSLLGSKSSWVYQQGSESEGFWLRVSRDSADYLRKPRAVLGHQRHLRHHEAKWNEKAKNRFNLVRQQTNVVVCDVTSCMAPLLISPRTGFPRTKLGWSRATRDGVGKKSRLWGLRERTVGCTSGGVGHGIRQRKRTLPCSSTWPFVTLNRF